jgi:S-adenosylmethionine-dependent methyltransferase
MTTLNNSKSAVETWRDWQATPWGRLFYTVARLNLHRHLQAPPLRILDVGGGNGLDAVYLAQYGHHVTLVDVSADMIAAARDYALMQQVEHQIVFHQANVSELAALDLRPAFDMVLCHNLLQYIDDPSQLLESLSGLLKDNGYISIIGANRYAESFSLALQHLDFEAACAQLQATSRVSGVFGKTIHLHTPEQIAQALQTIGCALVGQYGIRCFIDYIPNNDLKLDPAFFSQLERLECAMTDRYPYYLLARHFHLVARNVTQP